MNDRSSVTDIPEDRSQPGDAGADGAEPETVTSEKRSAKRARFDVH